MLKKLKIARTQQEIPKDNSVCAIFIKRNTMSKRNGKWLAEKVRIILKQLGYLLSILIS